MPDRGADPRRDHQGSDVLVGEVSDAVRARTIVAGRRTAALSTLSADAAGAPFGSLVGYAADERGRPLLCLSDLAEHSRNLAADRRASLLMTERAEGDPLALGRVTLLGEVSVLDRERENQRWDAARDLYRAAHPEAFYVAFRDFRFYRLEIRWVRLVGGFGRMRWLDAARYADARPDPWPGTPPPGLI